MLAILDEVFRKRTTCIFFSYSHHTCEISLLDYNIYQDPQEGEIPIPFSPAHSKAFMSHERTVHLL